MFPAPTFSASPDHLQQDRDLHNDDEANAIYYDRMVASGGSFAPLLCYSPVTVTYTSILCNSAAMALTVYLCICVSLPGTAPPLIPRDPFDPEPVDPFLIPAAIVSPHPPCPRCPLPPFSP